MGGTRETQSSAPGGYFGALKDGVMAQSLGSWKIGTAMGYLGRAAIGGQAWGKRVEARVEIPSGEGSPDLTWSQIGWPQVGASSKHGFWVAFPPLLLALQWARYPDLENMGLRAQARPASPGS